ncbi:MAG: flagellar biosynthesis anti-sigma factor FlgM [Acidobacteriota bacterium]|jgi:hypothetical protein
MDFGPRKLGSESVMKVDPRTESTRSVPDVPPTRPTAGKPPSGRPVPPPGDAVNLSGALRLADEAVRAAALSGDVRPHAVDRARQLLATGELGSDPEALADRIIDSLLETRDPGT